MSAQKIGIMADSHGQPEAIETAIELLKSHGCDTLYHLGDICDTRYPETADRCVQLLKVYRVRAVKGNNDHVVVVNHQHREDSPVSPETLAYLTGLPQRLEDDHVWFTHSLPFVEELGAAGMMWSMGFSEATRFFGDYPSMSLFRGHSHTPEIMYRKSGKVLSEPLLPGRETELSGKLPFVITCGALMNSVCMMWQPEAQVIQSLSLPVPAEVD